MAAAPEPGVFLERRSYRRRRLLDGLKLLPVLGIWLFLIPTLWTAGDSAPSTGHLMIYVFIVWFGLSVACALLLWGRRRLRSQDARQE